MSNGRNREAPEKLKRQQSSRNWRRKFSVDEEESPFEKNSSSLRRSLRRGSSFSFLTPRPQWDFSLKRKGREKDGSDAVSLCSFDFKERAAAPPLPSPVVLSQSALCSVFFPKAAAAAVEVKLSSASGPRRSLARHSLDSGETALLIPLQH
ncbi:hypothetical protein KUCAC02_020461 [Chaenocephalus aceratus]|nr:hypothetical protein KUCAC02_020461 [Chaenocephalus aceratus]